MKRHFKRTNLSRRDFREAKALSVRSDCRKVKIPEANDARCTKSLSVSLQLMRSPKL